MESYNEIIKFLDREVTVNEQERAYLQIRSNLENNANEIVKECNLYSINKIIYEAESIIFKIVGLANVDYYDMNQEFLNKNINYFDVEKGIEIFYDAISEKIEEDVCTFIDELIIEVDKLEHIKLSSYIFKDFFRELIKIQRGNLTNLYRKFVDKGCKTVKEYDVEMIATVNTEISKYKIEERKQKELDNLFEIVHNNTELICFCEEFLTKLTNTIKEYSIQIIDIYNIYYEQNNLEKLKKPNFINESRGKGLLANLNNIRDSDKRKKIIIDILFLMPFSKEVYVLVLGEFNNIIDELKKFALNFGITDMDTLCQEAIDKTYREENIIKMYGKGLWEEESYSIKIEYLNTILKNIDEHEAGLQFEFSDIFYGAARERINEMIEREKDNEEVEKFEKEEKIKEQLEEEERNRRIDEKERIIEKIEQRQYERSNEYSLNVSELKDMMKLKIKDVADLRIKNNLMMLDFIYSAIEGIENEEIIGLTRGNKEKSYGLFKTGIPYIVVTNKGILPMYTNDKSYFSGAYVSIDNIIEATIVVRLFFTVFYCEYKTPYGDTEVIAFKGGDKKELNKIKDFFNKNGITEANFTEWSYI